MKSITLIATLLLSISSFAQIGSDLEIYAVGGEKFTVTINDRVLNEEPASRVVVTNIDYDNVHVIIDFEDEAIPNIEKKYLRIANVGEDEDKPVMTTYKVVEKKGNYKLRFGSRSNKKIQQNTVIINQQQPTQNGVGVSNGRIVVNW